jgi:hypothetical protein
MPISNLMDGSFFTLGTYFGGTLLAAGGQFLGRGAGDRNRYGDHGGGVERFYCDAWRAGNSPTCLLAIRSVPLTRTCFLLRCKGLQLARLCRRRHPPWTAAIGG